MAKSEKNLLANGKNAITARVNMLWNVQSNISNNTSATNLNAISTPTLTSPVTNLNLQKAQQPVQTRLDNLNVQTLPTQNLTGVGNVASMQNQPEQSRFIWFQQWKSWDKAMKGQYLYVPTKTETAETNNFNEELKYNTNASALDDLQKDIYNLKRILTEEEIKTNYPEFKDNVDDIMKLQKEIKPILAKWNMVTTEWLEQKYSQLLSKDVKDLEKVKEESEKGNERFQAMKDTVDRVLRGNWEWLSTEWLKRVRDMDTLIQATEEAKRYWVVWGANDYEIMSYLVEKSPELQAVLVDMKENQFSNKDKAILRTKDANLLLSAYFWDVEEIWKFISDKWDERATPEEIESVIKGKEALDEDFANSTLKKISTELWVSLDSLEKKLYRAYKNAQNWGSDLALSYIKKSIPKEYWEKELWISLTDEEYEAVLQKTETDVATQKAENKQNVLDYTDIVNKEYENKKATNLNPDIENYVNNRSMTNMLLQWDLKPFTYKSSWEAAQNVDNLVIMWMWIVAPQVVLPAMFADSYARESQESFEELVEVQKKMGVPEDQIYDNAQKWSVYVWLASSLVEVGLEKLLWWVETTASKAFHDLLMKDFTERATKMVAERGLIELLKQWAVTQFKASMEEWLEEVFQQAIHNKSLQQYDPDQKLTEWMLESFEWGFYNWMNLLAWGGDVMSNIDTESMKQSAYQWAYNLGENTRNVVDTVKNTFTRENNQNNRQNFIDNLNNKVTTNQTTDNQNTSITPVNNAITPVNNNITPVNNAITTTNNNITESNDDVIELKDVSDVEENTENEAPETQEKDNTDIKEWVWDKLWGYLSWIEENTRQRMQKNPYSAQENKALIDKIESDPWIDINDYMLDRYDEVLDSIEDSLDKEEKRRKDVWKLYQTLEETNAPVDTTNLKNKIPDFQQKMEDLWDILSTSDQSKIKTILENIQQIWDWTMDVWKARKIADQRSKRWEASTDWLRLIREIRDAIDEEIRVQRPEMKEVDQEYRKSLDVIRDLRWNLVNKRTGEFKGNAVNIVKNLLSGTNRAYLQELEKYVPWVKERLQAIRDVKFVFNAYETWNWSRFQSWIARAVFWNIFKFLWASWGLPWVIAWAAIDAGVESGMKSLTRKALKETVTQETERSRAELEKINQKIEEWKQLDEKEKQKLKELGEKIVKNAEEAKKTKAEQDAWDKYFNDIKNQQALPESIKLTKVTEVNKTNKPKNKVTKKSAKSVDKNVSNQYNTTDASSTDSSVDLSQNEEKATWTKNSSSLAKPRGWELEWPTTVFSEKPKTWKTQTIWANFDISNVKQEYKDNFDKVINWEAKELPVWRIDWSLADDGQERDAIFSEATNTKVDRDHWIDKSNLLWTINKPDYIIKDLDRAKAENPETYKEKINLIRKIPWTNNFVLVAAERQNWFFILTNYEVHRNNANKMMKEIRWYAKRWIIALDTIWDLTEALNKVTWGKNAVTNKNNKESETKTEVKETPKTETKTEEDTELREKIGDRFYDYLQKQVDIINENRKEFGKEPITVEDLNLNDELYINKFEKIAQEELSEIQNELSEINKDLPQAPALTDNQRKQLNKAENQTERNKLLRKWQDEWLENNPISEEKAEQIREIMERAADIIEQHNKARNYIYDSQIAEENKEYEDKYSEEKEAENPKKKESKGIDAKTRKKILAGDGVLIFSSWEFKFIPSLEQGLIRLTREEWDAKLREQIESAFDDSRFHVNIWGDEDWNTYVYNDWRQDLQDLEEETTWETIINKENYKDFKLLPNWDIEFELDPDATFEWFKDLTVDLQDFLNNSRISRYAVTKKAEKEANNKVTTTEKNKITNTQPVDIEYLEEIDPQTLKILKDMWDKAAIKLYEEMGIEDDVLEQLYLDMERERLWDNAPSIFEDEAIYQNNQSDNETAQIPTIFEEDLQESNLRNLDENETAQTTEEEMNKVTSEKTESKPKNLVTNRIEESDNTDSKAEQIFNTSMEQLKGAKKVSLGALGKVKQTEVKLDNWTTITYIDSSVWKWISQNAIIRINSPEAWYKTYVVTKIPNNPAEIREWGNVLTDEQVDKVYDILQWKNWEVKVEDMKVDVENVEDKKDPINAFLDNNEAIKNDPKLKYKYLSRLNDQTSWIDYSTDIRYNWTVAEKVQQTIGSFGKLSNWTRLPIKFSKNNYGNYIEVGDWETGLASRDIWDDIEFEYAKFLYDNPEIRSTKEIKADWLKEAIKKWNEIHKEVVKDAEELKEWLPLDPGKYVWQQPTADEWIDAVYNETKKVSDYFEARKEFENSWRIGYSEEYRNKIKEAQDALWRKLKFKSDRSKLYQDFVKNIRESNWNEKQLRSIAKNLYIQKVKDDFKNNYNYPTEVTDKVPWLRTAKDNYDRYLKGRDTSFSGKDPRIDYSDKDRIWAWIKRQDWNQITAEQRRDIVNGVLEYAKYMGIDMKKMSEDAGVTYVHLNWKHPFLTSKAVWLFHWTFKSISVWADMESYREKMGQSKDAKTETHTVPVVMAHEITHAIDSMFEWSLFSDQKTREMGRKMNEGKSLWAYWHSKEEITARMVEEYVDVMKGWKWYYNMRWYWNKDVFDNEIKPYVEQIFNEKFDWYRLSDKEREAIKLYEAPKSNNSVTATDLNKVTSK